MDRPSSPLEVKSLTITVKDTHLLVSFEPVEEPVASPLPPELTPAIKQLLGEAEKLWGKDNKLAISLTNGAGQHFAAAQSEHLLAPSESAQKFYNETVAVFTDLCLLGGKPAASMGAEIVAYLQAIEVPLPSKTRHWDWTTEQCERVADLLIMHWQNGEPVGKSGLTRTAWLARPSLLQQKDALIKLLQRHHKDIEFAEAIRRKDEELRARKLGEMTITQADHFISLVEEALLPT